MIVVDIETTGVDPEKNSIASIGAVDFEHPENQFYGECRIEEGKEMNPKALEVNGFTEEQLKDPKKRSVREVVNAFLEWTEKIPIKMLAGENVQFDSSFLQKVAKRYNLEWKFGHRLMELHAVSYSNHIFNKKQIPMKEGKSDLSLDKTLMYVGLPEEPRPHIAINGAKMEAEAFARLIYGKQLLEEFKQYPVPEHLKKAL